MAKQKVLRYDYDAISSDGTDDLTQAILSLLNDYPALDGGEICFGILDGAGDKAMFPISSVAILSEKKDITSHVIQKCAYSFIVVSRLKGANETRKAKIKEWLDNLGRWLEKQPIKIGDTEHKLDVYPALTGDRAFDSIARQSQSYLYENTEDGTEDWAIAIQAIYQNEFDRD